MLNSIADEYVVFVTPSKLQLSIFATILKPEKLDTLIEGSTAESLALIGTLTKVSNSPILLKAQLEKARMSKGEHKIRPGLTEAVKLLPERAQIEDFSLSGKRIPTYTIRDDDTHIEGKLTALASLLKTLRQVRQIEWCMFNWKLSNKQYTEEKCILVSHYTSTLNILEAFCKKQSYTYLRLDG